MHITLLNYGVHAHLTIPPRALRVKISYSNLITWACPPAYLEQTSAYKPQISIVEHVYLYSPIFFTDTTRGNLRKTSLTRAYSSRSKAGETLVMAAERSSAMALYGHGGHGHAVVTLLLRSINAMDIPSTVAAKPVVSYGMVVEWHNTHD